MKDVIKKILKEFKIEELKKTDYRDGVLSLEYVEGYDYPKYVIYYDSEDGNEIVTELDSRFFDGQMAETIMQYLTTRE